MNIQLTCCPCPRCRVGPRQRGSHTASTLTNKQRAHHDQCHQCHFWTLCVKVRGMFVCSAGTDALAPFPLVLYFHQVTSSPAPPAQLAAYRVSPASARCKLRSCRRSQVLKCIMHQLFSEMLTAHFAAANYSAST